MKKHVWKLLACISLVGIGCNHPDGDEQLSLIDDLLAQDELDSAYHCLAEIPLTDMKSEADSAYYYLIQTEINRRRRQPSTSDSAIIYSVHHYKNTSDKIKLARALYYQGVTTYNKYKMPETILLIKQAEELANQTDDLLLQYKICDALAYYNGEAFEMDLCKCYAQKALSIAKTLKSEERQATALLHLIFSYLEIGKKDSALICANECGAILQHMHPANLPHYYLDLGRIYEKEEPILAKVYLKKAIDMGNLSGAYYSLANIYLREDSAEKANEMWEQALYKTRNSLMNPMRIDIFNTMRQQCMERKEYERANALADSAMAWQKRYYQTQEQERLAEIQAKYDKKVAEQELMNKVYGWGMVIMAVVGILIIGLGYYSYRGMKAKKALAETMTQLTLFTRKAEELEAGGEVNAKEVARLNKKIDELQNRHAGILAHGKILYEAVSEGSTTVTWGKNDFADFIEYYKLKDLPYVNELETEYNHLSAKYMFFAILEHEGRSDDEIMRILGISDSTMRSTRSRINNKRNAGF